MQEVYPYEYSFQSFVANPATKPQKRGGHNARVFQKQGDVYWSIAMGGCLIGGLILLIGFFAIGIVSPTVGGVMIGGGLVGSWLFYYIIYTYWRLFVGAAYGVPQCTFSATDVRPGNTLTVVYAQDIFKDVDILNGEIQLLVREAVEYSCGTDTCHDEADMIVDTVHIRPQHLMKGLRLQEKATFTIPPNAMPTFASDNNKIGWLVRVIVESDKVAKYENLYYFNVVA